MTRVSVSESFSIYSYIEIPVLKSSQLLYELQQKKTLVNIPMVFNLDVPPKISQHTGYKLDAQNV